MASETRFAPGLEDLGLVFDAFINQSTQRGNDIASSVVRQIQRDNRDIAFGGLRDLNVPVADVEYNLEVLNEQVQESQFGDSLLGMQVGEEQIPIALPGWMFRGMSRRSALDLLRHNGRELALIPTDTALESVQQGLGRFLSVRLAAKKLFDFVGGLNGAFGSGGPGQPSPSMLTIKVHSPNIHGARVHYSPAYFINYSVLS